MALPYLSNRKSPNAEGFYIVSDPSVNATLEGWTLPFAVASADTRLWTVEIDNTLNAVPVYLKVWLIPKASVTLGSTPCDMQFCAPASTKQTYTFSTGPYMKNDTDSAAICWACTVEPGTPSTTAPPEAVPCRMLYDGG